jgi:hypothetical protein
MHFHPGWSGPTDGFGYKGYYAGDDRYGYVNHQQDRRASGQDNQTVQNAKSDHPVSHKLAAAPSHWHEQGAPKDGSSADEPGSSWGRTGLRSETSVNDEANSSAEKSPEEVVAK